MSRAQILPSLHELSELYHWRQLTASAAVVDSASTSGYCLPCGTDIDIQCSCCIDSVRITNNGSVHASPSPVKTRIEQIPRSRRKIIRDESEDESVDRCTNKAHAELYNYFDGGDETLIQRAPASARSKNKVIILSDSEDETSMPPSISVVKKHIFCEDDEAVEDNTSEKSFDGEAEVVDGESIGYSEDEVRSVDDSDCEDSDENDWIVNTSEEDDGSCEESDLSDDDFIRHCARNSNKENRPNSTAGAVTPSHQKKVSATPRKAHFVDLSQSPDDSDTPPLTSHTNTKKKASATTPKAAKKSAQVIATPIRKVSQTEINAQRVAALSTGKKKFKSMCTQLAQDLYHLYNEIIFDNLLPRDLPVVWSKRLLTTAGFCRCRITTVLGTVVRAVSIELSTKVLDDEERLRSTLIHEMCHAANFLIDELDNAQHGKMFKKWGRKATKHFPEISIDRCHNYDIHVPHKFKCVNAICGVVYSRHSKKGINVLKQFCGVCKGMLEYQGIGDKDGNIAKPRQATGFSVYVKEHFARVKAELSAHSHMVSSEKLSTAVIMKELAVQYHAQKEKAVTGTATDGADHIYRVEVDLTSGDVNDELCEQLTALSF